MVPPSSGSSLRRGAAVYAGCKFVGLNSSTRRARVSRRRNNVLPTRQRDRQAAEVQVALVPRQDNQVFFFSRFS